MAKRRAAKSNRGRVRKKTTNVSNHIVIEREFIATITKLASDSGLYRSFGLNQFPDSDVVSMFQEYRIKSIKLSWMLVNAPNNNADFPTLYTAPQHITAGVPPTSRDEVVQYKGIKHIQYGPATVVHSETYTPYVPMDASTTGKKFLPSPWISTSTDTVPHYTSVEWISRYNSTSSPTHTLELVAHAVIEARGTR